ncbi:MAG: gliding motility-associated C-terminal domain-containing protein [Flavobacteriales bacterium]|nr:gliding motility-associated C-terminal domain-containing protein [Flavobacteriales bacterium]
MRLILLSILLFCASFAHATHNRAGEITYEHLGGLTFRATITTYTVPDSPADRPWLPLSWGDGTIDTVYRSNGGGNGEEIAPGVKKNIYTATHTYPSASTYVLSMEDPNRNGGILNIPNSVNVVFYIETTLTISPFFGSNSTPVLLNPPIDNACVNRRYIHNPGAFDPDGDSLSYELVTCMGEMGEAIIGYSLPNGVTINAVTGDLVWEFPTQQGEFNYAIRINEWRRPEGSDQYALMGHVIRDLQVTVLTCQNEPPIVTSVDEICVEVGDTLIFPVYAWDPDGHGVRLTATGGPLVNGISNASFPQPTVATNHDTAVSIFQWVPQCGNVQLQPHTMLFRAIDNPPANEVALTDYHTTFITVVAPSPKNPLAEPEGNSIVLNWDASICTEAVGYKVYRRIEEYGFMPDTCETGVPAYTGYGYIGSTSGLNGTTYTDSGLNSGIQYCYMVVACFADGAESYASEEFCAVLNRDLPIITHVSVRETDNANGSMDVVWSRPTELDTLLIQGPYEYRVYRSDVTAPNDFQLIETKFGLNDTIYMDTLIDTRALEFYYKIELFNGEPGNTFVVGESDVASSVYLVAIGVDNEVILTWAENVPWVNDMYEVYLADADENLTLLDTVYEREYRHGPVANGVELCFRIRSIGHYSADGLVDPLLNWSQIACATPVDTFPPCDQTVQIVRDCELDQNLLSWTEEPGCPNDIIEFRIYYTAVFGGQLQLIRTITDPQEQSFLHTNLESIAGCYAIVAVDSFMNMSTADTFCIDNCTDYTLPNVFTPGGDLFNDLFGPGTFKYVESVDVKIYNRWGIKLFETTDPAVNWDGTYSVTGAEVPDGVYYYVATVNEIRLQGVVPRHLHGFLHLIRRVVAPSN